MTTSACWWEAMDQWEILHPTVAAELDAGLPVGTIFEWRGFIWAVLAPKTVTVIGFMRDGEVVRLTRAEAAVLVAT